MSNSILGGRDLKGTKTAPKNVGNFSDPYWIDTDYAQLRTAPQSSDQTFENNVRIRIVLSVLLFILKVLFSLTRCFWYIYTALIIRLSWTHSYE